MTAVVEELLRIKEFREDLASTELRKRRHRLEEALKVLEAKRAELDGYRRWRVRREDELFDEIQGRLVRVRDLEDLKTDIALLRDKERLLEQYLTDAEKARQSAKEAVEAAIEALNAAIRATRKFEEFVGLWREQARRERERFEELELEDTLTGAFNANREEVE